MEDTLQINNFIMVWITVFASLCYCHSISHFIPTGGRKRLSALLPVIFLFFLLPLAQNTIALGGLTAFFVGWLCNFKLLLFAFDNGPLAASPPLPLHLFITIACLPIKVQQQKEASKQNPRGEISTKKGLKSLTNYVVKCLVIVGFLPFYEKKELVPDLVLSLMYITHVYVALELSLAIVGVVVRTLIGIELEPQFDEPYLSTSLQDFWGRRWNLMVTNILRPAIYVPVRSLASPVIGRKLAALPATFSVFVISAVMHEFIFYCIGRKRPNWVVSYFFLLHGVCLAIEIAVKKALAKKFQLPKIVSRTLAMAFILSTGLWIFLPALLRCDAEEKGRNEAMAAAAALKGAWSAMGVSSSSIAIVSG